MKIKLKMIYFISNQLETNIRPNFSQWCCNGDRECAQAEVLRNNWLQIYRTNASTGVYMCVYVYRYAI